MRFTVSMDDDLFSRLSDYCDKNYISRSGFISSCVNKSLNESEALFHLKSLSFAMNKIAETSVIDEETKSVLDNFSRFANMFLLSDNFKK